MKKLAILGLTGIVILLMMTGCTLLNLKSGPEIKWQITLDTYKGAAAWPSAPLYHNGKIYLLTSTHFYVMDSSTGNIIWKLKYSDFYEYRPGVKPVIDEKRNLAYFSGGGYIRCVDLEKRELKWSQFDVFSYTNIPELHNDELYIQQSDDGVNVLEPETGKIKKFYDFYYDFNNDGKIERGGLDKTVMRNNRPVFNGETMYINSLLYTLAIDISNPTDEATVKLDGRLKWISETLAPSMPPMLLNNNLYIAGRAGLLKLDLNTGENLWKGIRGFNVGPAYSGGKIISATMSVPAQAFAVDINTGKELWHTEPFYATPGGEVLVCRGKVYVATMGSYFCVDENTGKILWELEKTVYLPDNKGAAYSEKDNLVYLPDEVKGRLIAIKAD